MLPGIRLRQEHHIKELGYKVAGGTRTSKLLYTESSDVYQLRHVEEELLSRQMIKPQEP